MSWIRLDDHFDEHPKLARVGALGLALWTVGLAYCNRNLTDGFIPWAVAHRLLNWEFLGRPDVDGCARRYTIAARSGRACRAVDSAYVIALLVEAGLWEAGDGGYYVHDYADYQPRREQVVDKRAHLATVRAQAGRQGGVACREAKRAKQASPERQPDSKALANGQQTAGAPAANEAAGRGQKHGPNPNPNPNPKETLTPALSQGERELAVTPVLSEGERELAVTPVLSEGERELAVTPALSQGERTGAAPSPSARRSKVETLERAKASDKKARSPAQAAYLKAFGKHHFQTAAQAEALARGENQIGLPHILAAIDWAALKGVSDIQSILTVARKMEREGVKTNRGGSSDGRISQNGRGAGEDPGGTRSPTDGDGWLDPKYKDL